MRPVTLIAIVSLTALTVDGFVHNSVNVFANPSRTVMEYSSRSNGALSMAKDVDMTPEEREIAVEKATKAMTAFTNTYLKNTGTKLCADTSVPAVVIKGLAEHKVSLGAPLCPCRFYDDKEAEAKDGYWNCPCVPMRERHECHCMLFLTDDNAFVGEDTSITVDEVLKGSQGMQ
mmetsp:Transcript_6760/g.8756  ORF Transcript_6760/g.8756 Transcript_6760/m.8756 type:complete len:174 (+) Transcript_6760:261-782(+)